MGRRSCPTIRKLTGAYAYLARGIRLLAVHLVEHFLQTRLELLVLRALVELAHEVAAGLERVARETEGRVAEVLAELANLRCGKGVMGERRKGGKGG